MVYLYTTKKLKTQRLIRAIVIYLLLGLMILWGGACMLKVKLPPIQLNKLKEIQLRLPGAVTPPLYLPKVHLPQMAWPKLNMPNIQFPHLALPSRKDAKSVLSPIPKLNLPPASTPALSAIRQEFANRIPKLWGANIPGVINQLPVSGNYLALTFDACGGSANYLAEPLLEFLVTNNIPTTLFVSGRWIRQNPEAWGLLTKQPLFEIANHGDRHKPLSANGQSAYGIKGTGSVDEIYDEIYSNERTIFNQTGQKPRFYRSSCAHYDEVALGVAQRMGYQVIGYNLVGDNGSTQAKASLLNAPPGSIVIIRLNRTKGGTLEGIKTAITLLKERGVEFVALGKLL